MSTPRTLIIGIGSPHGDDQVGWWVADKLRATAHDCDLIVRKAKSPVDLLDWIDGVDRLMLCDACQGLGEIGASRRWTWPEVALQDVAWSGTHDLSLPAVLALAQRLRRLPDDVVVWAIQGDASPTVDSVSSQIAAAATEVVQQIKRELGVEN